MKTVILCGGRGTRLSEETHVRPKPMVNIGDRPILWHVMSVYAAYDFSDFICALGYMGDYIKEYFHQFYTINSDFTINLGTGGIRYHTEPQRNWAVSLIDTGADSMTGGRLLRLKEFLKDEETFMVTYGDGVADVNIRELLAFHKSHGKIATVTAVRPPARFGEMLINDERVTAFAEKPQTSTGWINGGFFVFNRRVFDYLASDSTILEREPLERLANAGELMAYKHDGFWQCMDTLRDKSYLNELWTEGRAPWIM